MPTTLTLSSLVVSTGTRTLVDGLDLVAADGDVVGIVGANGSGKTSLLRVVAGDLRAASGTCRFAPERATVAYLPQVVPGTDETVLAHLRRRTGVAAADHALQDAAERLAESASGAEGRYADAWDRWVSTGAADLDDRVPQVLAQVGLDMDGGRRLASLSGGQLARVGLAAVLLCRADVLLLDEPTNDLDAHGAGLVADVVTAHPGPVLLASHDRELLDRVATEVVELDLAQGRIGHFSGGWSQHVAAREQVRRQAGAAYEEYAATRDRLRAQARRRHEWAVRGRDAVARGSEPDKHQREKLRARADRQAARSGRLARAADRLAPVPQPRREWELRYSLPAAPPSADVVALLDSARVQRHGFLLGPVDLVLARGDRLAVTGDNGSGKSTLLHALVGAVPLSSGRRSLGARVRTGVLDQSRALLDDAGTVVDVVRSALDDRLDAERVRTLLAKFGLGPEHVGRPARSLSAGERTRALMALFSAQGVNLLVLDEPTNHLDVAAAQQLAAALASYDGTLVVVSHDRRFLDEVGVDRVLRLEAGTAREDGQAGHT